MRQDNPKRTPGWLRRARYTACLAIAGGLVLAGCGGDGDGDGGSQTLTRKQFVAKANAICAKARGQTAQFSEDFPANPSPQEAQQFFKKVAPYSQRAADEIAALEPPAGDDDLKTIQDGYQKRASEVAAAGKSPAKAEAALKSEGGDLSSCAFAPPGS
jgi:hypothetical protein